MLRKIFFPVLMLISSITIAQNGILDNYIKQGLESNLALKQKDFSLKQSTAALHEARGMFFPSVDVFARYSRAGGGRVIDIPVGDLVNPAYEALNQLIGQDKFPTNIPNEQTRFLREEEHDTKLTITQPVFQPQIYFNYKVQSNLKDSKLAERNAFARELVADIKSAYFRYLQTIELQQIYRTTEKLLEENLRISKSLYENEKVTVDAVYRAEAELAKIEQNIEEAEKNNIIARAYFNFLLNRELEEEIITMDTDELDNSESVEPADISQSLALQKREELTGILKGIEARGNEETLYKTSYLPGISFAFDYGFQGEEYQFDSDHDYWMASFVLQWNLFRGGQDQAKIEQAEYEKKSLQAKFDEVKKQIRIQVKEAYHNYLVAERSITAAEKQKVSAEKSFNIVKRKYEEGIVPLIEYIDSRTSMTQAQINYIITKYDRKIKYAEYEKATASYELPENGKPGRDAVK